MVSLPLPTVITSPVLDEASTTSLLPSGAVAKDVRVVVGVDNHQKIVVITELERCHCRILQPSQPAAGAGTFLWNFTGVNRCESAAGQQTFWGMQLEAWS
jgi:hypothetical protein